MDEHLRRVQYKHYIIKVFENETGTDHKYRAWGFINGSVIKETAFEAPSYHLLGDDISKLIEDTKAKIDKDW